MKDAGQARTRPDAPCYAVPDDFWDGAQVITPDAPGKTHISMRIDSDVLDWYRRQGSGYLTRMNAVLRSFMDRVDSRTAAEPKRRAKTVGAETMRAKRSSSRKAAG